MGINYLWSIKEAYPQVNLNYLVYGEPPILLKPLPSGNLTAEIDVAYEALGNVRDQLKK